jgi:hypothetical protein
MTYLEKKEIADKYIKEKTDGALDWDTLPDINSLHDCETKEEIEEYCDKRMVEDGFDFINWE